MNEEFVKQDVKFFAHNEPGLKIKCYLCRNDLGLDSMSRGMIDR